MTFAEKTSEFMQTVSVVAWCQQWRECIQESPYRQMKYLWVWVGQDQGIQCCHKNYGLHLDLSVVLHTDGNRMEATTLAHQCRIKTLKSVLIHFVLEALCVQTDVINKTFMREQDPTSFLAVWKLLALRRLSLGRREGGAVNLSLPRSSRMQFRKSW